MLTINMDDQVKKEFSETVSALGLNATSAMNLFARAVIRDKCIPFPITLRTREEQEWNDYLNGELEAGVSDMLMGRIVAMKDARAYVEGKRNA